MLATPAPATVPATNRVTVVIKEETTETELLRAECRELRKMLALAIPPPARTNTPGAAATTAARTAGQTHWLTEASLIRHNNACQYYQKSTGRACKPNEGTACRFCGG